MSGVGRALLACCLLSCDTLDGAPETGRLWHVHAPWIATPTSQLGQHTANTLFFQLSYNGPRLALSLEVADSWEQLQAALGAQFSRCRVGACILPADGVATPLWIGDLDGAQVFAPRCLVRVTAMSPA